MSVALPFPPLKIPIVDQSGVLTNPWAQWVQQLYVRVGSGVALSNDELNNLTSISTLQTTSALQTSEITLLQASFDLLGQGRVL